MVLPQNLFSLPSSLLVFLLTTSLPTQAVASDQPPAQWPYNLPPHVKYWPEDPAHMRRGLDAVQEHILAGHNPVAVKKMSEDEDEMFWPEYWSFEEEHIESRMLGVGNWFDASDSSSKERSNQEDDRDLLVNITAQIPFQAPFAIHAMKNNLDIRDMEAQARDSDMVLKMLRKRDFTCPTGTFGCTSINQPNYCCATGSSCFNITDTGLGPVGCCPSGSSCSGDISSCAPGNTPCPQILGGACCIPGFACAGIGCKSQSIFVVDFFRWYTFTNPNVRCK